MNAALFADISNLYYCVGKKYDGRKLDYLKLLEKANSIGVVKRAFAYGAQARDEASRAASFITGLRKMGYETKYKEPRIDDTDKRPVRKADWEVGIAMDVVRTIERVQMIILCSSNPAFVPLVVWVKDQVHCKVVILACGISRDLKDAADEWIEIDETLIEEGRSNGGATTAA